MYSNKMAAAIKSNGKVLREFGDEVRLPFGSEYSILVKNLNTVRAIVNIYVDGVDVTGSGLVINANSEVDLERYINNGNMQQGNRFKFVERNAAIENSRGIKVDDGLVRIEYKYEIVSTYTTYTYNKWNEPTYTKGGLLRSSSAGDHYGVACNATYSANAISASVPTKGLSAHAVNVSNTVNDVGITVPGSVSDQKFQTVGWFPTELQSHSMILRLVGEVGQEQIVAPVTVKTKQKCTTCNHLNKATAKYCSECGTGLVIV